MAVSFVAASAAVSAAASITPTLPTGAAAGDRVFACIVSSPPTTATNLPTGWTKVVDASLGTGTVAANTGARRITVAYRDYDGAWTMPAWTVASGSVMIGSAAAFRKGSSEFWESTPAATTGSDVTTTAATFTVTGAADPGFAAGDMVLAVGGHPSNVTAASPALTATGATIGSLTEQIDSGVTLGNNAAIKLHTAAVTAGASTAAPVHSYTVSTSAQSSGGVGFVRVRLAAPGVNRVQSNGSATYTTGSTATTSFTTAALASPATAGNRLIVVGAVDKSSGAFSPGSGWTIVAEQSGIQVSHVILTKVAAGGETTGSFSWATGGAGAAAIIAEYASTSGTPSVGGVSTPAYSDTAVTSLAFDPPAAVAAGAAALIGVVVDSSSSAWTPAATGWTLGQVVRNAGATGEPGAGLLELTGLTAGQDLASVTVSTGLSDQHGGTVLILEPSGGTGSPPTPTLAHRVVGIPSSTVARVATKTADATSVRLKVGTDTGVTAGVVYGAAATPDAQGVSQLTVSGLTAGTRYYYRVAMTDSAATEILDTATTVGTFRTAPTGQANFAFDFGSCCTAADSGAMAAIAARGDDLFFHLGDILGNGLGNYMDGTSPTVANYRTYMGQKIAAANHQAVMATIPTAYTPSDHDGFADASDATVNPTAWTNWNQVYRELFPTPTLPGGTTGVYYTFTWGRIRFIQLDCRSFRGASGTSILGATQKQWLKDTITAATEPVIVILQDGVWIGSTNSDTWNLYTAERTELGDFFAASGKGIAMLGGDMHAVAADSGTNAVGGIAVFQGAPLNQSSSVKGGPYSAGTYPTTGSATVEQYGRIAVTDTGTAISLAFTGYSADNTARVTLTKTYTLPQDYTASGADVAGAADQATDTVAAARTAGDVAAAVDGVTAAMSWAATAADTAAGADAATPVQSLARSAADTAAGADAETHALALDRQPSDAAAGADNVTAAMSYVPSAADTAGGTDAATAAVGYAVTAADTAAATDSALGQIVVLASGTDTGAATDASAATQQLVRAPADAAAGADTATVVTTQAAAAADAVAATDAGTTALAAARGAADAAAATDAVSASVTLLTQVAAGPDVAAVVDAARLDRTSGGTDTSGATDAVTAALSRFVDATDAVPAADTVGTALAASAVLADAAAIVDAASGSLVNGERVHVTWGSLRTGSAVGTLRAGSSTGTLEAD